MPVDYTYQITEKEESIMLISAILVALIAIGSQWWFSHTITRTWLYPIWAGFLVAVAMGEPVLGMKAAAYIQLTYHAGQPDGSGSVRNGADHHFRGITESGTNLCGAVQPAGNSDQPGLHDHQQFLGT